MVSDIVLCDREGCEHEALPCDGDCQWHWHYCADHDPYGDWNPSG